MGLGRFCGPKIKPCRFLAGMIGLIYNGWSQFVRLAEPDKHYEAIVTRPQLLHGIGKQTTPIRLSQVALDSGMCVFHRINHGRLKPLHVLRFSAHCQMPPLAKTGG